MLPRYVTVSIGGPPRGEHGPKGRGRPIDRLQGGEGGRPPQDVGKQPAGSPTCGFLRTVGPGEASCVCFPLPVRLRRRAALLRLNSSARKGGKSTERGRSVEGVAQAPPAGSSRPSIHAPRHCDRVAIEP